MQGFVHNLLLGGFIALAVGLVCACATAWNVRTLTMAEKVQEFAFGLMILGGILAIIISEALALALHLHLLA